MSYKEPTPPDTELVVRSHVVAVRENQNPGLGKAAVEVDVAILLPQPGGSEKLLVQVRAAAGAVAAAGAERLVQLLNWQLPGCTSSWVCLPLPDACSRLPRHACVWGVCALHLLQGTGIFKRLGALRAL